MDYFELSQMMKREVEGNPEVIGNIMKVLRGELEEFASGGRNHLFRIGRLESGLYCALRVSDGFERGDFPELGMVVYESYCKDAERSYQRGKRVPLSCGGFVRSLEEPILIVEDLSEGGKYDVGSNAGGNCAGYRIKDGVPEVVWFDLGKDDTFGMNEEEDIFDGKFDPNSLKYFNPLNRINLP